MGTGERAVVVVTVGWLVRSCSSPVVSMLVPYLRPTLDCMMHNPNDKHRTTMAAALGLSQVPGNCSFRSAAVNNIAVVPLLSNDRDDTKSAVSCQKLWDSLRKHAGSASESASDLLLVVPNSSLTRPGDWRYNETVLASFHWQHGCQRLWFFDGRPHASRTAHERLMNPSLTRDWIDLVPSRRTAAVIGVLNIHDCQSKAEFDRAHEELRSWATRYATPPYAGTAHGTSVARDVPVTRLFVLDSFDDNTLDLSSIQQGNHILAFPPMDHDEMMTMHWNIVLNDLAVAIFRTLEEKIKDSIKQPTAVAPKRGVGRIVSSNSDKESTTTKGDTTAATDDSSSGVLSSMAKASVPDTDASSVSSSDTTDSVQRNQLLTPLDSHYWDSFNERDAEAFQKRDVGRREKYAADLALLAGSPLDAFQRYMKAIELCKADPLWLALALEGCAAAHIAMAEAGGFSVDDYLENNFQLPEDIMLLAKKEKDEQGTAPKRVSNKQTLPEVVFSLCEDALEITSKHEKTAPFFAELALKLALYSSENAEGHLRCRWGEGVGCYAGDPSDTPRWLRPSVAKLDLGPLVHKGVDMVASNTFNRMRKFSELLHVAAAVGGLDPATRIDVATRCARSCLHGLRASQWRSETVERIPMPRKAAFFTAIAAEAVANAQDVKNAPSAEDLWIVVNELYSRTPNRLDMNTYGWATLRASTLHTLSLSSNDKVCLEAAELLMSLLGDITPETKKASSSRTASVLPVTTVVADAVEVDDSESSMDTSLGKANRRSVATTREFENERLNQATERATLLASRIREGFTTMTAPSAILASEAKWAEEPSIPAVCVPLGEPSSLSAETLSLGCVWANVASDQCRGAQELCMKRIETLRRTIPASSSLPEETAVISGFGKKTLPVFVSSVTMRKEPLLEIERVKKKETGAMATFFNPYANKAEDSTETRVARGEERSMQISFGNRLALPLEIERCTLVFICEDNGIEASPLSFSLPPNSKGHVIQFPFSLLNTSEKPESSTVYDIKGLSFTCLGRSYFLPLNRDPPSSDLPPSLGIYPHLTTKKETTDVSSGRPKLKPFPCQPRVDVFLLSSGAQLTVDSVLHMEIAQGELRRLPSLRLQNRPDDDEAGKLQQLQVYVVGLPGTTSKLLFDSASVDTSCENESDEDLLKSVMDQENPLPLNIRLRSHSLDLATIDMKSDMNVVTFDVVGAHNIARKLDDAVDISIRFRYRGESTDTMETWRSLDVPVRIKRARNPWISSLIFRPDLASGSRYTELCRALNVRSPPNAVDETSESESDETSETDSSYDTADETVAVRRVGLDTGMDVCSDEVVIVVSVSNDKPFDILLSRPPELDGTVGGSRLDAMLVKSGVSAKIPITASRLPREGNDGQAIDLAKELIRRTGIYWNSIDGTSTGYLRIGDNALADLIFRYPLFVSRVCDPPCRVKLFVDKREPSACATSVALGSPLDLTVLVDISPWVPADIVHECSLTLEFFCARLDKDSVGSVKQDYAWCGKIRERMDLKATPRTHRARLVFVRGGLFAVSACARIARRASTIEEIWWAPVADVVHVDKTLSPDQLAVQ